MVLTEDFKIVFRRCWCFPTLVSAVVGVFTNNSRAGPLIYTNVLLAGACSVGAVLKGQPRFFVQFNFCRKPLLVLCHMETIGIKKVKTDLLSCFFS